MTPLSRALGNGGALLVGQAITWTSTLVLTAVLGRRLGTVGFGELFLAGSFVAIFGLFVEAGLDQQVVRAVARDPAVASRYLTGAMLVKSLVAIVAYPMMLFLVALLRYDDSFQRLAAVYGLLLLPNALSASMSAVYQGSQRMLHVAIATVLEKVLLAAFVLGLFALGAGILEIAGAFVAASAIAALWRVTHLHTLGPVRWQVDRGVIRALVRGALPFLLFAIFGTVYYRIDSVLLSKMTDGSIVGWYAAAYRLFDTLVFVPSIIAAAIMFPVMARLSVVTTDQLRGVVTLGLRVISAIGAPLCVGLFVVAGPLITFIYGEARFDGGSDALRWLAPGLFLLYLNSILSIAVISADRERRLVIGAILCCAVNIALNLVLIPHYQHVAAAAVTTVTELALFAYLAFVLRHALQAAAFRSIARAAVAAIFMGAVLEPFQGLHVLVLVALGVALYSIAALALGVVSPSDLALARDAIVRRRAAALEGA